jgi:glycosyltransferase involved in cell wall biosynthesis
MRTGASTLGDNVASGKLSDELISIIVPIYNVEKYLRRCIESVIRQSHTNFELILVDDGSPDTSGAICDEFAARDDRIVVVHQVNTGLSDARNLGITLAKGEYITFIDSDDWIHEDYLRHLHNVLLNTNCGISCCGHLRVSGDLSLWRPEKDEIRILSNEEAIAELFTVNHVQAVVAWGKLYRATLFEGIRYPPRKLHEDQFTTFRLLYKAGTVAFGQMPYYFYFQHPDSLIGKGFRIEKRLAAVEAYTQRGDFLAEVGFHDLAAETYREVFLTSFNIIDKLDSVQNRADVDQFKQDLAALKYKLRKYRYRWRFKLLYEAYFLFPALICHLQGRFSR